MQTRPCSSCGARIGFIETPAGKHMPVDPEMVKTFGGLVDGVVPTRALVTERGSIVKFHEVSVTHPGAEAVEGFQPHWSTCTSPSVHRRT